MQGTFTYHVIPFIHKNANYTFQWDMPYVFNYMVSIILKNLDVLIARYKWWSTHLEDLHNYISLMSIVQHLIKSSSVIFYVYIRFLLELFILK